MFLRSQMFRRCSVEKCKNKWRSVCSCCARKLCADHLKQHENLRNPNLNPLVDQINTLEERFKSSNKDFLLGNCRKQLEQWYKTSRDSLEQFYLEKCEELDRCCQSKLEQQQNQFDEVRSKLNEYIELKETGKNLDESSPISLENLKHQLDQIEKTEFQIEVQPLQIDPTWINIEEPNFNHVHLSNLLDVHQTIQCTGEWGPALSSNQNFLLIDRHPTLCLINRQSNVVKEIHWKFDFIRDMSWSATLSAFILITRNRQVFLVHEKNLAIEFVETIEQQDWLSCTSSDKYLYLTCLREGTNLFQFELSRSFPMVKRWKPPQSCKQYEQILNIKYLSSKLAFVISNMTTSYVHFEVRSSATLDRLWILKLDLFYAVGQPLIRCSAFLYDQWLIIDNNASKLFQITKDGQIQAIFKSDTSLWNAVLFTSHTLAIRTKNSVNFHQL